MLTSVKHGTLFASLVALNFLVACTMGSRATLTPPAADTITPARLLPTSTPEAARDPLEAKVDQVFAMYDKPDSPGCALGVIQDGAFIYKRGYGMADVENRIPNTPSTVFRIASTSKQFTAAAVLLLAEEGKLSLDDDIRTYLPQLPDYGTPVTIGHLLHHTSGIPDYLRLAYRAGYQEEDHFTTDEAVEMIAGEALEFPPGEEHRYSNSGYFLLSLIVERASGKSLREYAEEKIFRPLGMTHTHFHDDHTEVVPNQATGYALERGRPKISMTTLDMVGDGGVFTTVEDLLLWDQNFYDQRIGGPQFLDRMLTRGTLNNGDRLDYAAGLVHGTYRGLETIGHAGGFVGFRADMVRFPEQRFTVICLCNSAAAEPTKLARRVADIYLFGE